MKGRFVRGIAAGTLIGAAAGMLLMPRMDRRTRKKMTKAGKRITEFTSGLWDGVMDSKR